MPHKGSYGGKKPTKKQKKAAMKSHKMENTGMMMKDSEMRKMMKSMEKSKKMRGY